MFANRPFREKSVRYGWMTFLCAILAGFTALFAYLLVEQRHRDWQQAEVSVLNLTESVQRDIVQAFGSIDRTLLAVRELVALDADFKFDPARRRAFLGDTTFGLGLGEIYILDEKGTIVLRSETSAAMPHNLASQPFFYTHERTRVDRLFTAKTISVSPLKENVVMMSRRLSDRHGRFRGVVAFALRVSSLNDLFRSLDLGKQGAISLYGTDGTLLLRAPDLRGTIGKNYIASPIFWALATARTPLETASPTDNVKRLFSTRHVGDLPLILCVALSTDDIYSGWMQLAAMTTISFAALAACVIFLSILLAGELRRRKRSESRYRTLAHVDGLTGLFNRRRFDRILETEFARAGQVNAPLSVAMIDVDRFKAYNDLYGHQAGDDCLKLIAQAIQSQLRRPADFAARYGGEEIALILPGTDEAGAALVCEAVRRAIELLAIPHARSDSGVATASLGVATALPGSPDAPETLEALLAAADAALYGAKRIGRNCVVTATQMRTGIPARIPANETTRLETVRTLRAALSVDDRTALDRITHMAAIAFGTKISLVTLVDSDKQHIVGRTGLDLDSTPRDISFCAHALGASDALVVLDAKHDVRFAGNPHVTDTPNIRFYAGAALRDPQDGDTVLGTLCIMDTNPRVSFSQSECDLLAGFAALAIEQLFRPGRIFRDKPDPRRASA